MQGIFNAKTLQGDMYTHVASQFSDPWFYFPAHQKCAVSCAFLDAIRGAWENAMLQFKALGFDMFNPLLSISEKVRRLWRAPRQLKLIRDSGLFDEAWYLSQNPDVAQAKIDPALHYLRHGGFEGRDPGPKFSSAFYLDTYPDVKAAGINPLVHYLLLGEKEGRQAQIPFRVFCISIQRTGTTSVGKFFRDFGFAWAGWSHSYRNNWTWLHYNGDYEAIFSSDDFQKSNAFEDSPWWYPGFYRILYHRFS